MSAYADLAAAAAAASAELTSQAAKAIAARGRFCVALSGGSTPKALFEKLVSAPIDWSKTHVFFADERAVPPTDEKSNYRLAYDTLLSKVPVLTKHVHRLEAERPDQEAAARDAEATLATVGALDVVLLGIGDDGHTASLFPGGPWLAEQQRLVVPSQAPVVPHQRLTLTYPALGQAAECWFLVSGASKRTVLAQAMAKDSAIPAGVAAAQARAVRFFVDREAASTP